MFSGLNRREFLKVSSTATVLGSLWPMDMLAQNERTEPLQSMTDKRTKAVMLIKNGKTDFTIVLPDTPQPVEQTAANELKTYLDAITGANWVMVSEKDVPEKVPQILIGNSMRAKKIFPEIVPEQIPYDGIEIHLRGNKLLLTGHEQRGTLYAVNTFLEDILGIRWWTSSEQTVPTYKTFKLIPLNISYAPKLIYRKAYYKDVVDNPVFSTRLKNNGYVDAWNAKIPPEYGDELRFVPGFVHTFFQLIPPKTYFADHQEWFSEVSGAGRHPRQLCLTNNEMRKELTKNAMELLRKTGAKFISISQEDGQKPCTCEKCKKVVDEEGSQSGLIVRFVNEVAEDIEQEFPDVFVETLAYDWSTKPPKLVKPRHNVVIRLCTIWASFVQPLTGEHNTSYYEAFTGWSKIAQNLFVWDYVTNFFQYIQPHPNLRVLAQNIRFFVDHGAISLFEQGDAYCTAGDFVRLRSWLISKLMWNPMSDENELIREFLEGYYGKEATPFLLEYFDLLINRAESTGLKIFACYEDTNYWLDYETLCKATVVFDKAMVAAEKENDMFVRRLLRERLPLEHVWLKRYGRFKRYAEEKGENFCGPADPEEAVKNFFAKLDDHKVTALREARNSFDKYKQNMLSRFEKPAPVPDELISHDGNTWMVIQEFDIVPSHGYTDPIMYVDDPAASNGRAVKLQGNIVGWSAHVFFSYDAMISENYTVHAVESDALFDDVDKGAKFKIVVYVRCDATTNEGLAMNCSIYDTNERKEVMQKEIDVSFIAGTDYRKIEFEPVQLSQSMYIRFAPPNREKEVQAVYIDRVLIKKINV